MTTQMTASPVNELFELSLDFLGTISLAGYFTRLNPAWEVVLGWTREELMAEPFLSFVHPDDVERTLLETERIRSPGATATVGFVNRYRAHDGSYRWINWTVVPKFGVMHFVARDITATRTSATLLDEGASLREAILDSVADGVYVADSNGLISFINPAAVRMLNYSSAS